MGHLIAVCLIDAGYEVARVNTPEEVSERIASQDHNLIVFNTGLPVEQKSSFIRGWREERPGIKVLEISNVPYIWRPMPIGEVGAADRYLPIPFDLEKLGAVVEECLSEQASTSDC
jgi:DNA-binding response OmpR family regulator